MTPSSRAERGSGASIRVVVLVGFMASGKSAVGARLATRLGWELVDVDAAVEAEAGMSVADLFRERGEAVFRELEARLTAEALGGARRVVATGGGWPAAGPGRLEGLPPDVLSVWLRVPVEVAVERARRDGATRPLLQGDDPGRRARELLAAREAAYARAELHIDASDPSADHLAAAIVEHLVEGPGVVGQPG